MVAAIRVTLMPKRGTEEIGLFSAFQPRVL
jgi:hypothetical protein